MNYYEWSNEYTQTAEQLSEVIERLNKRRKTACASDSRELGERLAMYRSLRRECLNTAAHLMERHRGAA